MKKIDYYLSIKGEGVKNEDCIGFYENYYWVIDGATGVFNTQYFDNESDCAYAVEILNHEIKNNLAYDLSLSQIIQKSIRNTYLKIKDRIPLDTPIFTLPSFACILIRVLENKIEYYVIGDCLLIVENEKIVEDNRIKKFSLNNANLLSKEKNKENRIQLLQKTRMKMNQIDGYPILSLDENSVQNGLSGCVEYSNQRIILMSDGLDFYLQNFDLLKCRFSYDFINEIISATFNLENERIKTNLKKRDDISVISLI